jgi:hypothetical protein
MHIEGLSPLQIDLANRIWSMDTTEEVMAFFDGLPRSLKVEAYIVYQMIVWAWRDEEPVGDCAEAREVIDYIRSQP